MKSKISFCNRTILRTDVTRFAPVWVLYTLGMLVIHLLILGNSGHSVVRTAYALESCARLMTAVNGLYALLVSQALFGELFSPRFSNAIHALPVTRDELYSTHVLSGFLFCFVPNTLVTLILLPFWGTVAPVGFWVMLCASLMFTCFFGSAALAVQLSGNRVGAVLTYGILNFAAVLFGWFLRYLYDPLINGISLVLNPLYRLSPPFAFIDSRYLRINCEYTELGDEIYLGYELDGGWRTLVCWAVVGVVLLALAQILYRRRKLECSGDLLAWPKLIPVFQVLFALTAGGFFHLGSTIVRSGGYLWMAILGIAVGWFAGRMLIERKLTVFSLRGALPLVGLVGVLFLTMLLTALDITHVCRKVPEADSIQEIAVCPQFVPASRFVTEDPAEFENILTIHREQADRSVPKALGILAGNSPDLDRSDDRVATTIAYTLKDGSTLERTYTLSGADILGKPIEHYFRRPEVVLGVPEDSLGTLSQHIRHMEVSTNYRYGARFPMDCDPQELVDAIIADCREETVRPYFYWFDHTPEGKVFINLYITYYDDFALQRMGDNWTNLLLTEKNVNTVNWLLKNGILTDADLNPVTDGMYKFG